VCRSRGILQRGTKDERVARIMTSFDREKLKTCKEWGDMLEDFTGIPDLNVWKDTHRNDIDWEIAPLLVDDGGAGFICTHACCVKDGRGRKSSPDRIWVIEDAGAARLPCPKGCILGDAGGGNV